MNLTKNKSNAFVESSREFSNVRDLLTLNEAPIVSMKLPATSGLPRFQGWPFDDLFYLWLFQTDEQANKLIHVLKTGEGGTIPLFDPTQTIQEREAITSVFKRGKASIGLIAAVRYIVRGDDIYVDFMAVRDGWKRRGINSAMLRTILSRHPGKRLVFSSPTREGKAFIEATEMGPIVGNIRR